MIENSEFQHVPLPSCLQRLLVKYFHSAITGCYSFNLVAICYATLGLPPSSAPREMPQVQFWIGKSAFRAWHWSAGSGALVVSFIVNRPKQNRVIR